MDNTGRRNHTPTSHPLCYCNSADIILLCQDLCESPSATRLWYDSLDVAPMLPESPPLFCMNSKVATGPLLCHFFWTQHHPADPPSRFAWIPRCHWNLVWLVLDAALPMHEYAPHSYHYPANLTPPFSCSSMHAVLAASICIDLPVPPGLGVTAPEPVSPPVGPITPFYTIFQCYWHLLWLLFDAASPIH